MSDEYFTDERMHAAMNYLAESDQEAAELRVEVERQKKRRDLVWSQEYLDASGSVKEREAHAEVSGSVQNADKDYLKALGAWEYIRAKRDRAVMVFDGWRSENKNKRQGVM